MKTPLSILVVFIFALTSSKAGAQQSIQYGDLFRSDKLLKIQIKYDIRTLQETKEAVRETGLPGTVILGEQALGVRLHPRGAGSFDCTQPQLKIDFAKAQTAATPFSNFKKIKLFTSGICLDNKTSKDSDKVILANYLLYRLTEKIFDLHFKTRLVDVTYEDTSGKYPAYRQLAFFLEPEKHIEQRSGATRLEQEINDAYANAVLANQLLGSYDNALVDKAHAFEFLIGNFDYGVPGIYSHILTGAHWVEKNVQLFRLTSGKVVPVVFDFDLSRLSYRSDLGCSLASPFFLAEGYDYTSMFTPCVVDKMIDVYSADLKKFRFANTVGKFKAQFQAALASWRLENQDALKNLGANYNSQLDAFQAAVEQAF